SFALVDIGVHQDGLVHISELSSRYVKDPGDVVKAGQIVKVQVLNADPSTLPVHESANAARHSATQSAPRPSRPACGALDEIEKATNCHVFRMAQDYRANAFTTSPFAESGGSSTCERLAAKCGAGIFHTRHPHFTVCLGRGDYRRIARW